MFTLHKENLLRNCSPILLLSKSNTNLKFRSSTSIAWSCMKLRLRHNPELLWCKVIKTCRCKHQCWNPWKPTREGRMNLKLLKNQFAFSFTLSICKICMFQSEKKKTEQRLPSSHSQSIALHVRTCTVLDWPPPPNPPYGTYFLDGPWNLPIFGKTCEKKLNPQICSKNIMRHGFVYISFTK